VSNDDERNGNIWCLENAHLFEGSIGKRLKFYFTMSSMRLRMPYKLVIHMKKSTSFKSYVTNALYF